MVSKDIDEEKSGSVLDTIVGTAKKVVAQKPTRISLKDMITWTLLGGASGLGADYLYNGIKGRDHSYGLAATVGSAMGAGAYLMKQNIMDMMDAHSTRKARIEREKKITKDPNAPPRTYIFYIRGAENRTGRYTAPTLEKVYGANNVINYKWGEVEDVIKDINSTRPQDRVIIMGHSAGGGAAITAAEHVDRHIDKLITLDPVQLYAKDRIRAGLGLVKKPDNVDIWENHVPENYDKQVGSNIWARGPLKLPRDLPGQRNILYKDEDHSLLSIGLRPMDHEDEKDTFDFTQIAKRVRKEIDDYTQNTKNRYIQTVPLS